MRRLSLFTVALLALAGSAFAQESVLRPGDQIELRLGGVPSDSAAQITGSYQVDGAGYVNLPHIGKVRASGMTQEALQNSIEQTYRSQQIFTSPTITINIPASARFVNIGGQVRSPQRVSYTPDLTLLSVINAAGGFTDFANQSKVLLIRDSKRTTLDVKEIRKDPTKDVALKPGDVVEVPMSIF